MVHMVVVAIEGPGVMRWAVMGNGIDDVGAVVPGLTPFDVSTQC